MKGMLVLSVGVFLAGCGCKKEDAQTNEQIEQVYDTNKVYDDVSTNLTSLYEESKTSTVRVIAGPQLGSGVVYKEEGNYAYILTNAHVVTDKSGNEYYKNIEIVFSNFVRVKGTCINLDKNEDVAVVRVDKSENYKVARIVENDSNVKIGDSVYSIGNPRGDYFSVTVGVISNNRIETTTDYISGSTATMTYVYNSTATINSGNSGGPMFNSDGEVIAINSMQPSDASIRNYNYSIPINYFIKVADYIVKNYQHQSSYVKSFLNIEVESICNYSVNDLTTLGITVKKGVYVTSSSEDVAKGRIITHVNGNEVATVKDYEFELLKYSKGDTITLTTMDIVGVHPRDVNLIMR